MSINATLIGQVIWFALFVFFCMKFVWPPIVGALNERKQKIAEGLSAADRAERDLELAQEKATANLKEAKDKAAEILDQANKRANQIVEEAKDQARAEHAIEAGVHAGEARTRLVLDHPHAHQ